MDRLKQELSWAREKVERLESEFRTTQGERDIWRATCAAAKEDTGQRLEQAQALWYETSERESQRRLDELRCEWTVNTARSQALLLGRCQEAEQDALLMRKELHMERKEMQAGRKKTDAALAELRGLLEVSRKEKDTAMAERDAASARVSLLETREEIRSTDDMLSESHANMPYHQRELADLRTENDQLRKEKAAVQDRLSVAGNVNNSLRQDLQTSTTMREDAQCESQALRYKLTMARGDYLTLRESEAALQTRLDAIEEKLTMAARDYMAISESERAVKSQLEQLEADHSRLTKELERVSSIKSEDAGMRSQDGAAVRESELLREKIVVAEAALRLATEDAHGRKSDGVVTREWLYKEISAREELEDEAKRSAERLMQAEDERDEGVRRLAVAEAEVQRWKRRVDEQVRTSIPVTQSLTTKAWDRHAVRSALQS